MKRLHEIPRYSFIRLEEEDLAEELKGKGTKFKLLGIDGFYCRIQVCQADGQPMLDDRGKEMVVFLSVNTPVLQKGGEWFMDLRQRYDDGTL